MSLSSRLRRLAVTTAAVALAGSLATACGSSSASGPSDTITIGYQPGLGYATLLIMKEQGTLEKAFPDTKIKWQELDSGGALRDAVIAGDVQIASMGAAPFLVGVDAGVGWKTIASQNDMNLELMVKDPKIKSLEDLPDNAKIAMPAPDSIQSVVLRKGAAQELGDAHALDDTIVSMAHPDGLQALVSGQITGHLTAPPYVAEEAAKGAHPILKGYDLFGRSTFNGIYAKADFADANKKFIAEFDKELVAATTMLKNDPDQASTLLSKESDGDLSVTEVKQQITDPDVTWTTTPTGFTKVAEFMKEIGMIKKVPARDDIFFDNQFTKSAN